MDCSARFRAWDLLLGGVEVIWTGVEPMKVASFCCHDDFERKLKRTKINGSFPKVAGPKNTRIWGSPKRHP